MTSRPSTSSSRACGGWSTAGTTPPASRWSPAATARQPQARRQARQPGEAARPSNPLPPSRRRAWATRAGPPTARRTTATRTRTWTTTARVAVIHNGIIENFADAARRARGARATRCARTPTPRSSRTCSPRRTRRPGSDLAEAMRRVCRRLRRRVHAGRRARRRPGRRRRRAPQLPARRRRRRRRELPRQRRRRVHRAHPRGDRARPGPGRRAPHATRVDGDDLRRRSRPTVRPYHVDWDASAAEKGGYDHFMLKEIAEQPRAVADTLLGRRRRDGPADARRDAAVRRGAARRRQGRRSSRAARRTTPGCSRSTRSSTGPGCRARSSWPASSATATRS